MQEWQAFLIESLEYASDMNWQRLAWLEQTIPPYPIPIELICNIFLDTSLDDMLSEGVVFSEKVDSALMHLSILADGLNLQVEPESLLSSDEWVQFAREAERVLILVREHLTK